MALTQLFDGVSEFVTAEGDKVTVESLQGEGKVLGIYFSAHWCPPCRGFTPKLASWYKNVTGDALKGKFEIVFLSSDRNEEAFDEYRKEMPWTALPYSERDLKAKLSGKFKVSGIPTLVMVDGNTGATITLKGRGIPTSDPDGAKFPWVPPTFEQVIAAGGGKLINKDNTETTWNDVKNGVVGLYFSAHWCGPCRSFTPELAEFYKLMKGKNTKFEIIFVSSDRTEEAFKEYLSDMPWWALPFGSDKKEELSDMFDVSGIPTLVLLDGATGETITTCGREMVGAHPKGENFPWYPQPLEWLHGGVVDTVQEKTCLVYFTDGSEEQISKAKAAMTPVATPYFEAHKNDDDAVRFLYTKGDDLAERLADFIKVKPPFPCLIMLDMSSRKKWVFKGDELDSNTVTNCFERWQKKEIEAVMF